jgi:hypothetical protein
MGMWKSRVVVVVASAVLASGCAASGQGQGQAGTSSAPSSTGASEVQILALAKEVTDCIRSNGLPGFPDPYFENGELKLPPVDSTVEQQGQALLDGTCHEQWQRLEALLPNQKGGEREQKEAPHPMSAEDLEKLKDFTKCLREHGMPNLPDPDENGTYHLGAAGYPEHLGKGDRPEDATFRDALQACEPFRVDGSGFQN